MARLNTYTSDESITGSDKVIGTDANTGGTKNYTLTGVGDWLNTAGAVRILGQANYTFQADGAAPRRPATLSLDDYLGDGTAFEDVTYLNFSKNPSGGYQITPYLNELVSKQVIIAHLNELQNFGLYTLVAVEEFETGFLKVTLNFEGGSGSLTDGSHYGFAPWALDAEVPQSGVDFDPVGTDNSTDVTLNTSSYDYLSLSEQEITLGQIDYDTDITNLPTLGTASSSAATDFVAVTGDTMTGDLVLSSGDISITPGIITMGQNKIDGSSDNFKIMSDSESVSGSSTIEFSVDGSEKMRIGHTGNVGIGTTAPAYKLDVNGDGRITGMTFTASGAARRISTHSAAGVLQLNGGTSASDGAFINIAGDSYSTGDYVDIYAGKTYFSGNVGIGSSTPNNFGFLERVLHISAGSASSTTLQQAGLVIQGSSDADDAVDFGYLAFTNYQSTLANDRVAEIRALRGGTVDKGELTFLTADGSTVAERMRITSGGNVGIGTSSPDTKLHVNVASTADYVINANSRLKVKGDGTLWWGSAADYGKLTWDTGKAIVKGQSGMALSLGANNSQDHLYINTSGNVGIGTTSPNYKLHVEGNVGITEYLQHSGDNNTYLRFSGDKIRLAAGGVEMIQLFEDATQDSLIINEGGADVDFRVESDTDTHALFLEGSSGRIGIGTASPSEALHIYRNAASAEIRLQNNTISSYIRSNTDNLNFYVSNGEKMRITSSGNVGIGTTSPGRQLELRGQGVIRLNAISGGDPGLDFNTSDVNDMQIRYRSTTDALAIYSYGTSSDVLTIKKSDGNVGIGTTGPDTKLHIYENASAPVLLTLNNYQGDINPNGSQGNFIDFKMTDDNATFTPQVRIGMIVKDSDGDSGLISEGCGNFVVYTGEGTDQGGSGTLTEHFRITDKGKVGIGTTSPAYKLDVNGSLHSSNITLADGIYHEGDSNTYINFLTDVIQMSTAGNVRAYINSSGNVGIGTTSPSSKLEVSFAASVYGARFTRNDAAGSSLVEFANSTGVKSIIGYDAGVDGYRIGTPTANNLTVKRSGNVGIGTTSPESKLHVNGTAMSQFRMEVPGGPSSNTDSAGREGDFAYDDAYLYVKTASGWGRVALDFSF